MGALCSDRRLTAPATVSSRISRCPAIVEMAQLLRPAKKCDSGKRSAFDVLSAQPPKL
jgi:hypothetical protein